jgi:dimethylhistidine N-methyltransferase
MAKHPSTIPAPSRTDALTNGVLEGMRKHPRQLSPVWFYDELGSFLFDSICELPEYYLTRTEAEIMRTHAADMAHHIGPDAAIIEFGSGTSTKTRLLLNHLEKAAAYVPVDIARDHLLTAASAIARDYSNLRVIPLCADFTQPFDLPGSVYAAHRRVVYFPGSTLGNFDPEHAHGLLQRMRQIIGANGAVLIGIDLKKDPRILERAYNDRAGVTAEFNVNALRHLNRELGTDFDLDAFEHSAVWVEDQSRIEMHLVSKREQDVRVGDETVHIDKGEHLTTEFCHKYTLETFANLAATAGLSVTRVWMDPAKLFSVQLLEPRSLQ